jgi:molybdate transport system regulatory protein
MELHKDVNEIEAEIIDINAVKGVMTIKMNEFQINAPLNRKYEIGDKILALISYDNIFLMLEPQKSSIRNIIKGTIVEMRLNAEIIRVNVDVGGVNIYSDITVSAEKELNLTIGKEIYIGFKAMSVATLKL